MRRLNELGKAEIQHLHQALVGDHDVARLQVAVDNARGVRGRKGVGDLHRVFQRFRPGETLASDDPVQRPPL
jgi:hypothetical protein